MLTFKSYCNIGYALVKSVADYLGKTELLFPLVTQIAKQTLPHKGIGYEREPKVWMKGLRVLNGPDWKDIPRVTRPTKIKYKIELHQARRAGTHLDLRLNIKGKVYDFAIAKRTLLPEKTGEVFKAIRRHNHSLDYFNTKEHTFGPGEYGEGQMTTLVLSDAILIYSDQTKIEFEIPDGQFKGAYCIFTEKSPHIPETILRMSGSKGYWKERMPFDSIKPTSTFSSDDYIAEKKYDGANFMLQISEKGKFTSLISRRLSVNGNPIDRSFHIPQIRYNRWPKKYWGLTFHGELIATDGKPNTTASYLNTKWSKFLSSGGNNLRFVVWDVEGDQEYLQRREIYKEFSRKSPRYDGRSFGDNTYRLFLRRIFAPKLILFSESNEDVGQSIDNYTKKVKESGEEGVVLKNKKGNYYKDVFLKDKTVKEEVVKIIGLKEGTNKYTGSLGALEVQTKEGNKVYVGTGFTDLERETLWSRKDQLIGSEIEIGYLEKTEESIRAPRFISFV